LASDPPFSGQSDGGCAYWREKLKLRKKLDQFTMQKINFVLNVEQVIN